MQKKTFNKVNWELLFWKLKNFWLWWIIYGPIQCTSTPGGFLWLPGPRWGVCLDPWSLCCGGPSPAVWAPAADSMGGPFSSWPASGYSLCLPSHAVLLLSILKSSKHMNKRPRLRPHFLLVPQVQKQTRTHSNHKTTETGWGRLGWRGAGSSSRLGPFLSEGGLGCRHTAPHPSHRTPPPSPSSCTHPTCTPHTHYNCRTGQKMPVSFTVFDLWQQVKHPSSSPSCWVTVNIMRHNAAQHTFLFLVKNVTAVCSTIVACLFHWFQWHQNPRRSFYYKRKQDLCGSHLIWDATHC